MSIDLTNSNLQEMNNSNSSHSEPRIWICNDFGPESMYLGQMKMSLFNKSISNFEVFSSEIEPGNTEQMAYTLYAAVDKMQAGDSIVSLMDSYDNSSSGLVYDCRLVSGKRIICFDTRHLSYIYHLKGNSGEAIESVCSYNINDLAASITSTFFKSREIIPILLNKDFEDKFDSATAYEKGELSETDFIILPKLEKQKIKGRMIFQDRFGNIITDIHIDDQEAKEIVLRDRYRVPFISTPIKMDKLTPYAYMGSDGFLEVCLTGGNAAKEFGIRNGQSVVAII